jgi:hypothetical protein
MTNNSFEDRIKGFSMANILRKSSGDGRKSPRDIDDEYIGYTEKKSMS